jgi:prepilin-type N-terminal cleavage/methylation domain-containing protein
MTRRTQRGFTLVELVTAASLMTVMMLGVVEVFGIITQTAGDAEGLHFAQREARAVFDRLHDDLRGMTREGYLMVKKGSYMGIGSGASTRYAYQPMGIPPNRTTAYGCDTLAFVTVGPRLSQMRTGSSATQASCAEVVYTNYVKTDQQPLQVEGNQVDPRRGILGRALWLLDGDNSAGGSPDQTDQSAYDYLCYLFEDANENQSTGGGRGGAGQPTLPQQVAATRTQNALTIWPWLEQGTGGGSYCERPLSLNRVMACCISEFYVEVFDPDSQSSRSEWFKDDKDRTFVWSKEYSQDEQPKTWPRALRITVAVHDPGDRGDKAASDDRFRGFAMQEVFWFGDP